MELGQGIHNYYETLVGDQIIQKKLNVAHDTEFIADPCCLALSHLPARYIRHEIDMAFFLSASQRYAMEQEVTIAIENARTYLLQSNRDQLTSGQSQEAQ